MYACWHQEPSFVGQGRISATFTFDGAVAAGGEFPHALTVSETAVATISSRLTAIRVTTVLSSFSGNVVWLALAFPFRLISHLPPKWNSQREGLGAPLRCDSRRHHHRQRQKVWQSLEKLVGHGSERATTDRLDPEL